MILLEFNGVKFYAIRWEGRIGFLNTQLYKVLNLPYPEYIARFLKTRKYISVKNDYTILEKDEAFKFKDLMIKNGIKDITFRKAFFIYDTGLIKFLNVFQNEITNMFKQYLIDKDILHKEDLKSFVLSKENTFTEIKYKNKYCRIISFDNQKWAVSNDVCDILEVKRYLYKNIPSSQTVVIKAKLKTNAVKEIRVINIEGIRSLMKYTFMTDEKLDWFQKILTSNNKSEQIELNLCINNKIDEVISNKSKEIETDIEKNSISKSDTKNTDVYNLINSISKTNMPEEIKMEYISSILVSEGIISNDTFRKTKTWMESNQRNY